MTKRKAVHSHIFFYRGFLVFIRIKSFKSRWKRERERERERELYWYNWKICLIKFITKSFLISWSWYHDIMILQYKYKYDLTIQI